VAIPADRGRCGVVERYVHMAAEAAWPRQSSDGRLRESKLGLFDYMLKSFDLEGQLPGTAPQRFVFNDTATTVLHTRCYSLALHDSLSIAAPPFRPSPASSATACRRAPQPWRSTRCSRSARS
jgi:hypothetical protein